MRRFSAPIALNVVVQPQLRIQLQHTAAEGLTNDLHLKRVARDVFLQLVAQLRKLFKIALDGVVR